MCIGGNNEYRLRFYGHLSNGVKRKDNILSKRGGYNIAGYDNQKCYPNHKRFGSSRLKDTRIRRCFASHDKNSSHITIKLGYNTYISHGAKATCITYKSGKYWTVHPRKHTHKGCKGLITYGLQTANNYKVKYRILVSFRARKGEHTARKHESYYAKPSFCERHHNR